MENPVPPFFAIPRSRWMAFLVVVLVATSLTGCVRRRMTIRSNPPGALVYVDNYEIGNTPVSHNFTYYGTRSIRLVKDGYETKTVMEPIRTPWWQIPPIDFVTENLIPGELTDNRTFTYTMTPQRIVPPDELRNRAEGLRSQMQPVGYRSPVVQGQPNYQPNYQPGQPIAPGTMPPGTMTPGTMTPGVMPPSQPAPYTQPGEWIPPGSVAPTNVTPQPPSSYYTP